MRHAKGLFILGLGLVVSTASFAQKATSASAARAENAALSLQIKQQKEAMELIKQSLDSLKSKVDNPTNGLEAVRKKMDDPTTGLAAVKDKIDHPDTGLEARIKKGEGRKPEIAMKGISCKSGSWSRPGSCTLNCLGKNSGIKKPYMFLKRTYENMGTIKVISTSIDPVSYVYKEFESRAAHPRVKINSGYTSATCEPLKVKYCTKTQCSGRGCARKTCRTYAEKSVSVRCTAVCGTVGYRRTKK